MRQKALTTVASFLHNGFRKCFSLTEPGEHVKGGIKLYFVAPEIAAQTHLSILTVNAHRRNTKEKFGANTIVGIFHFAQAFDWYRKYLQLGIDSPTGLRYVSSFVFPIP